MKTMNEPCPNCGSHNIAGLMASFWAVLENNEPKCQWRDLHSETELTEKRNCSDCGHEWDSEL